MPITIAEIKQALEDKPRKAELQEKARIDDRIRFNVVPELDGNNPPAYRTQFLKYAKANLSEKAYPSFRNLLRSPYPTVSLFKKVFASLEKVFDAKDSRIDLEFRQDSTTEDFEAYLAKELGDLSGFQKRMFETMKTSIHTLVVIDMPRDSRDPYLIELQPTQVIDYGQEGSQVTHVIYAEEDRLIVVDDQTYRVYPYDPEEAMITSEEPEVEAIHNLPYCPARWFWTDQVDGIMSHPILDHLSDSDHYLFFKTASRYTETYAAWPVVWGYDPECDYEYQGQKCEGGYLHDAAGPLYIDGHQLECPTCKTRTLGPGTHVKIPAPDSTEGIHDMRDPVGFIKTPVESLRFVDEKVRQMEKEIYEGITGHGGEVSKTQAMNIDQVLASVESRRSVLMSLKKNFETFHKWVIETMARVRHGEGFQKAHVDYGTQFYFFEPEQILTMYNEARKEEVDDAVLDQLRTEYLGAKYKSNPKELERMRILDSLDPFKHRKRSEVKDMPAREELKYLKLNFSSLIARFEREQGSILAFGIAMEYGPRIDQIRSVIEGYIEEEISNTTP